MTEIEKLLADIEERAEKATPGPWTHFREGHPAVSSIEGTSFYSHYGSLSVNAYKDGEFIAASRTDVPRLVAALREVDQHLEDNLLPHHPTVVGIRNRMLEALRGGQKQSTNY